MSRTLGSFNRRVNLPTHQEDRRVSRSPRIAAIKPERIPEERGGTTEGAVFASGRGNRPGAHSENRRYAGNALNVDLRNSTGETEQNVHNLRGQHALFSPPLEGTAESRTAAGSEQIPDSFYYA